METSIQCVLIGRSGDPARWQFFTSYLLTKCHLSLCPNYEKVLEVPVLTDTGKPPLPKHWLSINTPLLWQRVQAQSHRKQVLWLVTHFSFCGFPDKVIRHRACSLKDTAHAIFAAELDPEFDRMCEDIKEARKKRGRKIHWKEVFFPPYHSLNKHVQDQTYL